MDSHIKQLVDAINQVQQEIAKLDTRVSRIEKALTRKPPVDLEATLRGDPDVQRLLKNANWRGAAEAAIAHFVHGTECEVPGWKKSATWQQVMVAWKRHKR